MFKFKAHKEKLTRWYFFFDPYTIVVSTQSFKNEEDYSILNVTLLGQEITPEQVIGEWVIGGPTENLKMVGDILHHALVYMRDILSVTIFNGSMDIGRRLQELGLAPAAATEKQITEDKENIS